jgi:hypothetical protein
MPEWVGNMPAGNGEIECRASLIGECELPYRPGAVPGVMPGGVMPRGRYAGVCLLFLI